MGRLYHCREATCLMTHPHGGGKPRPKYSARIEQFHGTLLDTLVAIMGHAPDSINVRGSVGRRGETLGDVISIGDPRDVDALFHELGHFWSQRENPISWEAADSLRINLTSHPEVERMANLYADVLRRQTGRQPERPSDSARLQRLLERAERLGTPRTITSKGETPP